ncbi:MAG: flagellar hook-length control protein FliK [candidate division Zixibacteria bacterium]|nr:flagellar hook-length control protein FliK [candidate division Zixibacteria bacterium]MDH3935784.1 flagellar hook-length control protein FliK [candidate division Zixibacteria bacterium]MDH4032278.1 flagellar hook-length control protein FliK [candidate division Zixibacteria bacterium]
MINPNDMNIDFLLGLGAGPDGSTTVGKTDVENSGPLFAEMLNEMLMSYPGASNRPVVVSERPEGSDFAGQLERLTNPTANDPKQPVAFQNQDLERPPVMHDQNRSVDTAPRPITNALLPALNTDGQAGVTITDKLELAVTPTAANPQAVVEDNVVAFNKAIRTELPVNDLPIQHSVVRMNLAVPTNLETGRYEVIESSRTDGTIQMKLVDPTDRGSVIQVSLPSDQLVPAAVGSDAEQSSSRGSIERVDLKALPRQTTNMERLFSQLNLKHIEVNTVKSENDSIGEQLTIKLSGVKNADVDFHLRTKLPQDQVKAVKVELQPTPEVKTNGRIQQVASTTRATNQPTTQTPGAAQGMAGDYDSPDELLTAVRQQPSPGPKQTTGQNAVESSQPRLVRAAVTPFVMPTPSPKIRKPDIQHRSGRVVGSDNPRSHVASTPPVAATIENEQLLTTFSQSLKQGQVTADKMVKNIVKQTTAGFDVSTFNNEFDAVDPLNGSGGVHTDTKIDSKEVTTRNVRFSLPEDLASKLKPNGQSVMIRIQPDNLGPARLSLRMHLDKLSARITVETVEIKAVVEQSLDRLTQQLVKSGIDIEKIEVALDGRQSGEQLSERHPHWRRQTRENHVEENNLTESNEVSPPAAVSTTAPAYVGSGGLNVLA